MKAIHSDSAPAPIGPYSQGIRAGSFLFLSGQLPINPETGRLEAGGIQEQTRRILTNIREILKAGNATLAQVVKATVFLTDLKDFAEMNFIYDEFFSAPYPARSTVQVAALPAGSQIEIEVVVSVEE
jgi:2-iminobutanoate/2-iminopropanoate deaminase